MGEKLVALLLPAGLVLELIYIVVNRFIIKIPDIAAYPILIVSIGLMLAGILYNVNCSKNHKR